MGFVTFFMKPTSLIPIGMPRDNFPFCSTVLSSEYLYLKMTSGCIHKNIRLKGLSSEIGWAESGII
jgi:hypothetical protein